MYYKSHIILGILIILILLLGQYAIEESIWNRSKGKFLEIEDRIVIVEKTIKEKPIVDSLALAKLDIEVKQLDLALKDTDNKLRIDFYWLLRLGIPLTVIGFIGFAYAIYQATYNLALKQAKEELSREIMDDSKYVKTYYQLLLLRKNEGSSNKIEHLLRQHGFQKIESKIYPKAIKDLNLSKYEGILLNSSKESGDFTATEIKEILANQEFKGVILKYGGGRVSQEVNSDRLSGATMLSQLNPNLANILIYQKYRSA